MLTITIMTPVMLLRILVSSLFSRNYVICVSLFLRDCECFVSVAEGEDAPEKMSMMNKVKAKAKKIKNTLTTKQGHGHDEEQDHDHDQDDEDEEINQVPEVHGASQKRNDTKITEPITKPHSPRVYGTPTNPTGTGQTIFYIVMCVYIKFVHFHFFEISTN